MTAIQILERLGADASFHPSKLTDKDNAEIIKLSEDSPEFNAPLILHHHPAEEEPEKAPEEAPEEEKSDDDK